MALLVLFLGLTWTLCQDPYALEKRALDRVSKLRPGMTEPQVWKVLGLEGYGIRASTAGSGPRDAWPSHYALTPDRMLSMAWDLTKEPPILLGAQVDPNRIGPTIKERLAKGERF